MIKHIAMWRLKEAEEQTKQEILNNLKIQLEALNGEIEGMISLEVGFNYKPSDSAYDAVLVSVHTDREALEFYQKHPKHEYAAKHYVIPFIKDRAGVDYEL